jgi:hypothetical protein
MPKFLTRSLFAAITVLLLFVASSALGARPSHSERTRAGARHARAVAHRGRQAHKAAHKAPSKRKAPPKPPVKRPSPVQPVSPIEPTPPIVPVEPVTPVVPAPPVEPVAPVAPTPPVEPTPAPPTASFTFTPAAPVTGQAVALNGAGSTCADGPCTYAWSDDGGATRPIPALWPLGSGQSLSFTFAEVGTKYVRLLVTDAAGRTATIEHNLVVAAPAPVSEPEPEPEPTPISPPANTTMPAISGTATEGQQLSTTNGAWSGEPTSYAYQWRHCNTSGRTCTNISGATSSRYTLAASDVGDTMRVMVTAANSAGSSSMSSPTTATVTAPAPTTPAPANTALPTVSGTATEGQTLSATNGSWSGSPSSYSYQWQDCNGAGANCSNIGGASNSSSYVLGAGDVGDTVRVVVSATNAGGSTQASSAVTATIAGSSPTPPAAPANTALPAIGGTATEGQTLSASEGTWTGTPSSYSYQWQRCGVGGGSCANLSGAVTKTYSLSAADVGSTMRVVVSASNGGGTTTATSTQTATVTAHAGQQTACFSAPGACGYPDPNYGNVGPSAACSSLTPSGSIDAGTAGETIENMDISGEVAVTAKDVTITNDCISSDGGGTLGSRAVSIAKGVTGTQITHSNIGGANSTGQSVEEALSNNYANVDTVADHDYIHNCGECVHGAWTLTNSYVIVNGTVPNCGSECPDHYEDIYCDSSTFVAEHDVLLNPEGQTAVLFCDTNGGSGGAALNHITLTDSLVAGGGYTLYPQGNSSSVGSSTMDISNNRFGRCTTATVFEAAWGTSSCKGGADTHGYWPMGGDYGVASYIYCPPASGQVWSDNVWDDNNETVGC